MKISFEELPNQARIWIYPSNRPFTEEELERLIPSLDHFVANWAAHGTPLKAAYTLPYRRFIVLGVDQDNQKASGCSIDSSVRFIQEIEEEFQVTLLAARAAKTIGPRCRTRMTSVNPPDQIITIAEANVPKPYIAPQSP